MLGTTRLDRCAPRKKDIEAECQPSMFSPPPEVRDLPVVTDLHWKLKDERVLGHFNRSHRRIRRGWQDLYVGSFPAPRAMHTVAAEAAVASNLMRSGSPDLVDHLLPLSAIERGARLDGDDLLAVGESQLDLAGGACEGKIEGIRIAVAAVILSWLSDALEQNEAQLGGVKVSPTSMQKI